MRVEAECLAIGKCARSTLTSILQTLHRNGVLLEGIGAGSARQIRGELQDAQAQHALERDTEYGKVVQTMRLPFEAMKQWSYCHPMAWLHYASQICEAFSDLNAQISRSTASPLTVVLYVDGLVPGNPLRHDRGRTMHGIYWAITQWPGWVLSRVDAWPCFGVVLQSTCAEIDGGVASILPFVLKEFWPREPTRVTFIVHRNEPLVLELSRAGWIAVLDAHSKDVSSSKLVSSTKACMTCENIVRSRIDVRNRPLLRCLDCCEPSEFVCNSDDDVYKKADELRAAHEGGTATKK